MSNIIQNSLAHVNNIYNKMKFICDIDKQRLFAFLGVSVEVLQDGSFGHSVYRKPTHTYKYLHAASHPPPTAPTFHCHIISQQSL